MNKPTNKRTYGLTCNYVNIAWMCMQIQWFFVMLLSNIAKKVIVGVNNLSFWRRWLKLNQTLILTKQLHANITKLDSPAPVLSCAIYYDSNQMMQCVVYFSMLINVTLWTRPWRLCTAMARLRLYWYRLKRPFAQYTLTDLLWLYFVLCSIYTAVYGVNTGFGKFANTRIANEDLEYVFI